MMKLTLAMFVFCATAATAQAEPYKTQDVMDVSRTEKTLSYVASPTTAAELIDAINYAKKHGLKVSIKGTNHSHGGHNRRSQGDDGLPRGIQIDMLGFNKILHLDKENNLVTVQPGVTWRELSIYLNDKGLAAMTEQSSNIFSIGGSVSTNVHGRDVHGPLINSIQSLKLVDASGTEKTVSRKEQPELFRAIIGGYGAFGIITEITLKIEKNYLYEATTVKDQSIASYQKYLQGLSAKPSNLMHYGRVNVAGNGAYEKISYVEWNPIADKSEPANWKGWKLHLEEKGTWVAAMFLNLMRYRPTSEYAKRAKDTLDRIFLMPKTGAHETKNNVINTPVQALFDHFYNKDGSVDILQEYFVPVDQLGNYLQLLKTVTEKYHLDLLNMTTRYVPKITRQDDSLLSPYSDKQDLVAIVLYFNVQEPKGLKNGLVVKYDGSAWTQELIQGTQNRGGTFYWPYHRWWRNDQITHNEVENIKTFFKLKDQVDAGNLFESDFIFNLRKTVAPH